MKQSQQLAQRGRIARQVHTALASNRRDDAAAELTVAREADESHRVAFGDERGTQLLEVLARPAAYRQRSIARVDQDQPPGAQRRELGIATSSGACGRSVSLPGGELAESSAAASARNCEAMCTYGL